MGEKSRNLHTLKYTDRKFQLQQNKIIKYCNEPRANSKIEYIVNKKIRFLLHNFATLRNMENVRTSIYEGLKKKKLKSALA